LVENQGKLDKQEDLMAEKKRLFEQVDEEYRQAKEEYDKLQSKVGFLSSNLQQPKVSQIIAVVWCSFV
jgi:cell shape-determining protein MreC